MAHYTADLTPPDGHAVPPLLQKFADWLAKQEYGSVGYFYLVVEPVVDAWEPAAVARMRRNGFAFLRTPDGGQVVLLAARPGPAVVALLGSEGATDAVAGSLEEFLHLLAAGETGVSDLDDEDATGRAKLRAWLTRNKVTVPPAEPFDFPAYLDGTEPASPTSNAPTASPVADLPPAFGRLVALVGRRADDPELVDYVTNTLGQKVPTSTTDVGRTKNVVAKKHGVELCFGHDILNEKYPLLAKSKSSFVPYLRLVWLNKGWSEPLPFGLAFGLTAEELTTCLGEPRVRGTAKFRYWERTLDPARDVELSVDEKSVTIAVSQARELSGRHGSPSRPVVGLFVAWAVSVDLLFGPTFHPHRELVEAIRRRERQGTALVDAALPRGLWDSHLVPVPGLRDFAYGWFHNIGGSYIRDDLVSVFGAREGPHGHDEPVLDDDTWDAVSRAIPTLNRRFIAWV